MRAWRSHPLAGPRERSPRRTWGRDTRKVYNSPYTAVEKSPGCLWKSGGGSGPSPGPRGRGPGKKIRGPKRAPVSRKTLNTKGLELLLGLLDGLLRGLLGCLLGGLLRCHGLCHLLLAELIDRPESRVLIWLSLAGRGPRVFRSVGCRH